MNVVTVKPAKGAPEFVVVTLSCGHKQYHRAPFKNATWPCNACISGITPPGPSMPATVNRDAEGNAHE